MRAETLTEIGPEMRRGPIRRLNGLRGLAALIVMISHYSNATGWLGGYAGHGAGQVGVALFFMLSGFLISYLYFDRCLTGASLSRYARARVARVMPLYAVVICGSFLLNRADLNPDRFFYTIWSRQLLAEHLLLLRGKSVFWTVCAEMQAYLLLPVFWLFWQRARPLFWPALIGCATLILLASGTLPKGTLLGLTYRLDLPGVAAWFLVGMALGRLYDPAQDPRRHAHPLYALMLAVIVLAFPQVASALTGMPKIAVHDTLWVFVLLSAVFAVIVFLVPDRRGPLSSATGDFIGRVSFSAYLLHLPVLILMQPLAEAHPGAMLVPFIAATAVVSALSFTLIERPCARLLRGEPVFTRRPGSTP